jgi:hypothetical protein
MGERIVRWRAAVLLLALAGFTQLVVWLAVPLLSPRGVDVESALSAALAWALLCAWVWLATTGGLMAVEAVATGQVARSRRIAPRLVRGLVVSVCGSGLAAGLLAPALADTPGQLATWKVLDGLPLPDRAVGAPVSVPSVTVRPGDTLSSLAREYGTDWTTLYLANRAVVGADPDLIRPGQRLVLPPHPSTAGDVR